MKQTVFLIALIAPLLFGCGTSQTNRAANNSSLAAAATPGTAVTPVPVEAPRISIEDAKKAFDSKTAVFIDTHSADYFAEQHIPGAININAGDLAAKEDKIPKGKKIIAYCS